MTLEYTLLSTMPHQAGLENCLLSVRRCSSHLTGGYESCHCLRSDKSIEQIDADMSAALGNVTVPDRTLF